MAEQPRASKTISEIAGQIWANRKRDNAVGATFNQGRDELKEALRAFPDSIHVQPVSITGHNNNAERLPSPSEIARDNTPHVQQDNGQHQTHHRSQSL
jgi:hypothetical protein